MAGSATTPTPAEPNSKRARGRGGRRTWTVAFALGLIGGLITAGRSSLVNSVATLDHLDWVWLPLAVAAEAVSMAAFARTQRRLRLPAGPTCTWVR